MSKTQTPEFIIFSHNKDKYPASNYKIYKVFIFIMRTNLKSGACGQKWQNESA